MDFTGAIAAETAGLPHVSGVHTHTHMHTEQRGVFVFLKQYLFTIITLFIMRP